MDEPIDPDRELRKQIAESAAVDPGDGTIFTRAFQFFAVPLLIVGACVGIYLLVTYLVTERRGPTDWVNELRVSGPMGKKHAAAQLVAELRRQTAEQRRDPALAEPIIALFKEIPPDEAQANPEGGTVRQLLARCLGILGDKRATPVLLDALRTEQNVQTQAALIDSIGALKDPEAASDLIKLLDHPSSVVRKYATFTLGALAGPAKPGEPPVVQEAVQPLKERLKDSRPEVQWNAAFALAYFLRDPAGVSILKCMLDRTYVTEIVTASFKEPGGVGDTTAANASALIAHVLRRGCSAVEALGELSLVSSIHGLAKNDPDLGVRDAAMKVERTLQRRLR
jgi:hypothetical protein